MSNASSNDDFFQWGEQVTMPARLYTLGHDGSMRRTTRADLDAACAARGLAIQAASGYVWDELAAKKSQVKHLTDEIQRLETELEKATLELATSKSKVEALSKEKAERMRVDSERVAVRSKFLNHRLPQPDDEELALMWADSGRRLREFWTRAAQAVWDHGSTNLLMDVLALGYTATFVNRPDGWEIRLASGTTPELSPSVWRRGIDIVHVPTVLRGLISPMMQTPEVEK